MATNEKIKTHGSSTTVKRALGSSIVVKFQIILGSITYPLDRALFGRRVAKYEHLQIRQCSFHGGKDFLSTATKAMETLGDLDRQLHDSLLQAPYEFWDEPAASGRHRVNMWTFKQHCGIGPAWLLWKEQGMITCMVYTYFRDQLLYGGSSIPFKRVSRNSITDMLNARIRDWLEEHHFPHDLAICFPVSGKQGTSSGNGNGHSA
ncbi:MAG TPA: hypothetical protein VN048_05295 [Verrucomicrobiae bacterium]|jgi:hypothetical protein|nr:hypothetical protein [Verrucomicrobiae bacterium]